MMARLFRILLVVLVLAYLAALALFAIGIFGLFGTERGPLAVVLLVPLGLPWNMMLDGVREATRPWLAILAPALNILILWLIVRLAGRRRRDDRGAV